MRPMVAGGVAAGHRIRLGPAWGDGGANGPFGMMLLIFPNGPCVTLDQPAATGRPDITPSGIMTAPTVSATTAATSPTPAAGGMNGVKLPVIALVTVSSVTAPAAAPATSPVPATNSACQPNIAAIWPRVAPTRPSSRSTRRRSTVVTTRVFTSATADSAPSTPRIRLLANEFCAAAWADCWLATERLVTRTPG